MGFKEPAFQAALKKSKKPIKSALLDQKLVAGLGNIYYVDEVLYRAKFSSSFGSRLDC